MLGSALPSCLVNLLSVSSNVLPTNLYMHPESDLENSDKVLVNNDGTIGCFNVNGSTQMAQPTIERVTVPQTAFATPTQTSDGWERMATA